MERIVGKTPVEITCDGDEINMNFSDGSSCSFTHYQECCESVWIDDVNGDWSDLIGNPLIIAEERTNDEEEVSKGGECEEWTFYAFRGVGGSVDVRWYGDSNGYYSTSVTFKFNPEPHTAQQT